MCCAARARFTLRFGVAVKTTGKNGVALRSDGLVDLTPAPPLPPPPQPLSIDPDPDDPDAVAEQWVRRDVCSRHVIFKSLSRKIKNKI